jgi:hypothetical protein
MKTLFPLTLIMMLGTSGVAVLADTVRDSAPQPTYRYTAGSDSIVVLHPSSRIITYAGRNGLHFTSIRGRAALPQHTAHAIRGTAAFWLLPLQDCAPATQLPAHSRSNPFFDRIVFLSDREAVQEIEAANFSFFFQSQWHPVLMAKFGYGAMNPAVFGPNRIGNASAGYFQLHALCWYQMAVTWDREAGVYVLYANGIKVGHSDVTQWPTPATSDRPAPWLYFGNPAYAMGDISFFQDALTPGQVRAVFEAEVVSKDARVQAELEKMFEGRDLAALDWKPDESAGWRRELDLPFRSESDYAHFFHQGAGPSVRFDGDGLRITTPGFDEFYKRMGKTIRGDQLDMTRMYLWTRGAWEGDLYVTVEFKIHKHGGLALLMIQAAGMQGEDFLSDYPLRSDGSMQVVHREDVRNYHWEFYREIPGTRNDLVSHACVKNPWLRPLSFQIENRVWELERWYRLELVQEGPRLRGAIDKVTVIDAVDTGFGNNGPVLRNGHVALRAMMRTDMTFRNLQIWTRPDYRFTTPGNVIGGGR